MMTTAHLRTALSVMALSWGAGLVALPTASAQTTQAKKPASAAPLDLNTASDAELLTVPGVGERILEEFLEYRPYSNIMEFRQELGKYVDGAQLDAWQEHVFVPTNPNSATMAELLALKGLDEATAQAIIDNRDYADWSALEAVLLQTHDQATVTAWQPYWVF